jgi:hypothetical protein
VRPLLAQPQDAVSSLRFRTTPLRELVDYLAKQSNMASVRVAVSGRTLELGGDRPAQRHAPALPEPAAANGHLR